MTRDLVIFRSGRRSLHRFWREPRSQAPFDIYVCPFEEISDVPDDPAITIGEVRPGPKWSGLADLLKTWSGWRDYRYVMLADDDLLMSEQAATDFFRACLTCNALLAQPALTEHSPFGHTMVLQNTSFLARLVTFVEVQLPTFRSDVLAQLLWTLELSETGWGWGLDALWPKLLGYEHLYIVDATPVLHTRPVGQMRDRDLELRVHQERAGIVGRFECPFVLRTRAGQLTDTRQIADPHPALLQLLIKGYDRIFTPRPELMIPFIQLQQGLSPNWGPQPDQPQVPPASESSMPAEAAAPEQIPPEPTPQS